MTGSGNRSWPDLTCRAREYLGKRNDRELDSYSFSICLDTDDRVVPHVWERERELHLSIKLTHLQSVCLLPSQLTFKHQCPQSLCSVYSKTSSRFLIHILLINASPTSSPFVNWALPLKFGIKGSTFYTLKLWCSKQLKS